MRAINIQISDDSNPNILVEELSSKLSERIKSSNEFNAVYAEIVTCIKDFSERAKKLSNNGTTIYIQKEFKISDVNVIVVLDYPKKNSFFSKLKQLFN